MTESTQPGAVERLSAREKAKALICDESSWRHDGKLSHLRLSSADNEVAQELDRAIKQKVTGAPVTKRTVGDDVEISLKTIVLRGARIALAKEQHRG